MPPVGTVVQRSLFGSDASSMNVEDNALLFLTLGFVCVAKGFNGGWWQLTSTFVLDPSFFCSTYTTLRSLLPLLPPHHLTRRPAGAAVGSYKSPPSVPRKKLRLKSAQRFTVWLAGVDIVAAVVLVWEGAYAAANELGLGGTHGGASRLYLACTARPTFLLVVALLSYANVVQGKSIALGTLDWIVWLPAILILGLGAGLAALATVGSKDVWIGLIVWETTVTAIVVLCFGRLLVAIMRVRKWTEQHAATSPWAKEQERIMSEKSPSHHKTASSFLPPIHANFSGISASFISTIGTRRRSESASNSLASHSVDQLSFSASHAPAVSYNPTRPSVEDGRDFRSPTPGSTHHLLPTKTDHSLASPASNASQTPKANRGVFYDQQQRTPEGQPMSFEELPRPSTSSLASGSTYLNAGGFVGSAATRQAIATSASWGTSTAPGSGGPKVVLSKREGRGAMIRIGGHLAGCLFGYALACPYLFMRLKSPGTEPPLFASVLLAAAVTQPAVVLAIQCWLSEGFWFSHEPPPVLTSSSASVLEASHHATIDMEEEPQSAGSGFRPLSKRSDSMPGMATSGIDIEPSQKGRVGRAMSMIAPHPKLHVLPNTEESSTSAYVARKASSISGHVRLRSLTLAKTSLGPIEKQRTRSGSRASRNTFAGFENRSKDTVIDIPDHGVRLRQFSLSPGVAVPKPTHSPKTAPADLTIDFLSSKVLPQLVPSVKVGRNTPVEPENAPLKTRRRSSVGNELASQGRPQVASTSGKRSKNVRNLSLPGISSTFTSFRKSDASDAEPWSEVDEPKKSAAIKEPTMSSDFALLRDVVKNSMHAKSGQRRSLGRSSKLWDRVEESMATSPPDEDADDEGEGEGDEEVFQKPIKRRYLEPRAEETETLGEITFDRTFDTSADEAAEAFAAHVRARRSPSPLELPSPTSPFWEPHENGGPATSTPPRADDFVNDESIIHVGSQLIDEEEIGIVQCATIRPVSRGSEYSLMSPTSVFSLRPTPTTAEGGSGNSEASRISPNGSITSQGFRNMLALNSWHNKEERPTSSADENSSGGESNARRRRSGLKPLALLGERDSNVGTDSETSGSEGGKWESKARPARRRSSGGSISSRPRRSSSSLAILQPDVSTIQEVDEDKRSGEPTPRASRMRATMEEERRAMEAYLPNLDGASSRTDSMPMTSTPPNSSLKMITPPPSHVNTGRRRHARGVKGHVNENIAPTGSEMVKKGLVEGGGGGGGRVKVSSTMRAFR
ncbi:hypothetical protein MNV49_004037 [Pseudohyphozyma bogoriensis]|nr:hypothetical protein MNV49_004037 [Pseudohyphozyma bogoriensis]